MSEEKPVSIPKAIFYFLLNIIVLPGLGTTIGGDGKRKRSGKIQLFSSLALIVVMAVWGTSIALRTAATESDLDVQTILRSFSNAMYVVYALFLWSFVSGLSLVIEAVKKRRKGQGPG